jgi:hypothetical protein
MAIRKSARARRTNTQRVLYPFPFPLPGLDEAHAGVQAAMSRLAAAARSRSEACALPARGGALMSAPRHIAVRRP